MTLNASEKERIKQEVADRLRGEPEERKVIIFGSFLTKPDPDDLDIAIFQDSNETYLPLAMKYRKLLRPVARRIPLDVIPVCFGIAGGQFVREIQMGEVVYER
jgi:hypothetical protein